MKFQVNILSSSGITRGDRQTDQQTDQPTDIVDYRRSCRPQNIVVGTLKGLNERLAKSNVPMHITIYARSQVIRKTKQVGAHNANSPRKNLRFHVVFRG